MLVELEASMALDMLNLIGTTLLVAWILMLLYAIILGLMVD